MIEDWLLAVRQALNPETLQGYYYQFPIFLIFIFGVPLPYILRWLYLLRFRQKIDIAFTKGKAPRDYTTWLRFIPPLFFMFFLAFLLVALARPQSTNSRTERYSEGIDIVLAIDISESMLIEDFRPNRLEAAKRTALNFIKGRFQDRIGLVVFSGDALSLAPLTTDYDLLENMVSGIEYDMIEKGGTAIGSALAVATNRLRESKGKSKVLILLSDGDNTAGNIDPVTAANIAKQFKVRVYTIAVGKDGKVPFGRDPFGNPTYVENVLDEKNLREIAKIGSGKFYRASNNSALKQVFGSIDQLEKSEVKELRFTETQDHYQIYLQLALVSLSVWLLLKSTFMVNPLED